MSPPQTPLLTVDIIIEMRDRDEYPVVLIERKNPPYGWALPGGFVDIGETVEQAARREASEETGLTVELDVLLGVYSDPQRDSRGHTASAVYVGHAQGEPVAQDDAAGVQLFDPGDIKVSLAFDHADIIADYVRYRQKGIVPAPG